MNAVKIFHCADIHLDSPFSLLAPSHAYKRRLELQNAMLSAMNYAKEGKTQLFFIAGDLFDAEYITKETIELLFDEIKKAPDCRFFITPGNHDPYTDVSPYTLLEWPENVHIFKEKERVEIDELGVDVYGVGFTSATMTDSPIKGYPKLRENRINILVCHGDLTSPLSQSGPVSKADIEASGFDYIALGHIHASDGILSIGKTYYAYSGCIEGRDFGETGYKGAIFGDIRKDGVTLKGIRFSRRRYEVISLSLDGLGTTKECVDYIRQRIKEYRDDTALRIILEGSVPEGIIINPTQFGEGPLVPYFIEIIDNTVPNVDFTDLERENTLRGVFYRTVCDYLEQEDTTPDKKEILLQAMKYGLCALADRNILDFDERQV
ncbi:MAG: hypothetical protein A2Y17_07935 [Clostridiales bacterium GWF2_38_85]|nr:MAG: hypothetical protein A2Y17_07935 [Clostridiales bacterium GWF2_38_85]